MTRGRARSSAPLRRLLAAGCLLVTAGCSSGSSNAVASNTAAGGSTTATGGTRPRDGATAAQQPWLVMTDADHGYAALPSGSLWVLLRTTDGWRTSGNATPPAVPTDGGLAVGLGPSRLAVGVLPTERLTISPYLTVPVPGDRWTSGELPGGLVNGPGALALSRSGISAVVTGQGGEQLVDGDGDHWSVLTTAERLAPGRDLHLDAVTWSTAPGESGVGWLTGDGPAGSTIVFATRDAGLTWSPATGIGPAEAVSTGTAGAASTTAPLTGTAVAHAGTPCRSGRTWLLAVASGPASHRALTVAASTDGGRQWVTRLAPGTSDRPVLACSPSGAWLLADTGSPGVRHVLASTDGGTTWADRGSAPIGVTGLAPTGDGNGYAVGTSPAGPQLWAVHGDGVAFTPVPLPAWFARLGGGMVM